MARSARQATSVLAGDELTADEQAAFDAMHDDTSAPDAAPEPAPAPAPEPEPVEEQATSDAEPAATPQQRGDAATALRMERDAHKETKAALNELRQNYQNLDQRTNLLLQRFAQPQQPAAPAPEIPDVNKDPIAHYNARIAQLQDQLAQVNQGARQQQQLTQQQSIAQAVQLTAQAQENEYRSATPDYNDAAAFLRQSRHQELTDLGFTNAAEREAMIGQEALQIAARSIQNGANFPAMIYKLAQGRGYKNAPAAPVETASQADAEQRLTRQAAGQQQARSLSTARGTAPQQMTAERLAAMSEREFDAWYSKATPEQQRAVFGA